jgi:hypothetical protein
VGEISVKTGNNARNGGKNSLNRLIRCVCGKKSAQIREILISESAWEEMTCLFAPSLGQVRHKSIQNSSPDTIQQRLQQTSGTHTHEAAGGEVLYPSDTNQTDEQIAE